MKKFLKSLLILTATIAACIILNPTETHAASTSDLTFTLNDDGISYSVTDCDLTAAGEVTIPATFSGLPVTAIGDSAFHNCDSLTDVIIPDSITTIGSSAFWDCATLSAITIPDSVTGSIDQRTFAGCEALTSVTIGKGITSIDNFAFYNCTSLKSITIPNGVTHIRYRAFYGCENLTAVSLPDSLTDIGEGAFSGCFRLSDITIPASVISIGDSAFSNCAGLTGITIPNGVTSVGYRVFFGCTGLTEITIPASVNSIGGYAFEGCIRLAGITIPASVSSIGYRSFFDCTRLTDVYYGGTQTQWDAIEIGDANEQLTAATLHLTYPEEGTEGYLTFKLNEDGLSYYVSACSRSAAGDLMIPATFNCLPVTKIGWQAFFDCYNLVNVTIPEGVTVIDGYAFDTCDALTTVNIPGSVTSIGRGVFQQCSNLANVAIPAGVTTIDYRAFSYCSSLTNLTIPEGVTEIGDYAFFHCTGLTDITLPNTLTSIGEHAFYYCTGLTEIDLPNSITAIGEFAFDFCEKLTSVVIPDGVNQIAFATFQVCPNLTSVTLPKSVTSIEANAFLRCSKLTDVYYAGTQAQWDAITIAGNNDPLLNANLHLAGSCANGHTYDNDFDGGCNRCDEVRQLNNTFKFENYRVVFADSDTTHKNLRVEVYKLGDKTVADPTDEKALKAIDSAPVTHWGEGNINKILLTDAGNYVLLLKYNVGTAAATKVPMVISVSSDPKLIIDKNNKMTVIDNNGANINHRVVVYYLGDQTVEDIYDEAALTAIDSAPETVWQKTRINKLALTKGGNYVLHLCYNAGTGAKQTVAQQFTVESIPTLSVDINNKVAVTEENAENKNHRAVIYFLGENTVEDPYNESAVTAAAVTTSKTYWGLSEINKLELKEGGNYVIHLYYNVGTSEKRTLAFDVTVNERPKLSVDENNKLVVTYSDDEITNPRAYIYNLGDKMVANIYDEAALKAIATPTQVWGLSSILNKQLTEPGIYVIHFYYSVGTSAKKTVALQVVI